MLEFPVLVIKASSGHFTATLVDLPDLALGEGSDPYAALQDLERSIQPKLTTLQQNGTLPTPSPADDRPTLSYDEDNEKLESRNIIGWSGQQHRMICHNWTNDVVYMDL